MSSTSSKSLMSDAPAPHVGLDAAKTTLAAGGLLAAFGVASCCALPIVLSVLGISAASLTGIGFLAAQYQRELFLLAMLFVGAAGLVMWRQRQARCAPGGSCSRPVVDWIAGIATVKAIALLVLAWWIDPPL